ncbi:hypothetical protein B4144_2346 [Bacillus atrophaeus]|nr:hypothetical protein B4144_2346 [Bacillus atrophaeus]
MTKTIKQHTFSVFSSGVDCSIESHFTLHVQNENFAMKKPAK